MWYVQTLDDNGEWCNFPELQSASPDTALEMMSQIETRIEQRIPQTHTIYGSSPRRLYFRIHPLPLGA